MEMNFYESSFLGKGWRFPPAFSSLHHSVLMVKEEEDIHQSLQILLSTYPGERLMHADYGCDLRKLLFEPLTNALVSIIDNNIHIAISKFEPRITLEKVSILSASNSNREGIILIKLDYVIKSTNTRNNFVFPYYLQEGTNITEELK